MNKPSTLCLAPWTHTYLSPQTERRMCCASRESVSILVYGTQQMQTTDLYREQSFLDTHEEIAKEMRYE